jgi:hypothetical protein
MLHIEREMIAAVLEMLAHFQANQEALIEIETELEIEEVNLIMIKDLIIIANRIRVKWKLEKWTEKREEK